MKHNSSAHKNMRFDYFIKSLRDSRNAKFDTYHIVKGRRMKIDLQTTTRYLQYLVGNNGRYLHSFRHLSQNKNINKYRKTLFYLSCNFELNEA